MHPIGFQRDYEFNDCEVLLAGCGFCLHLYEHSYRVLQGLGWLPFLHRCGKSGLQKKNNYGTIGNIEEKERVPLYLKRRLYKSVVRNDPTTMVTSRMETASDRVCKTVSTMVQFQKFDLAPSLGESNEQKQKEEKSVGRSCFSIIIIRKKQHSCCVCQSMEVGKETKRPFGSSRPYGEACWFLVHWVWMTMFLWKEEKKKKHVYLFIHSHSSSGTMWNWYLNFDSPVDATPIPWVISIPPPERSELVDS